MNPVDNPYTPGAGTPPPELAGREPILKQAEISIARATKGRNAKSLLLLGLRGVGKTVLLNRIEEMAEAAGCQTAIFEADPDKSLPDLITQQLYRVLLKLDRMKRAGNEITRAFQLLRGFASVFKVRMQEIEFGVSSRAATGNLALDLPDLFLAVAEAARIRSTTVVILIDEVQYISRQDLSALIMALHRISQRGLPLIFFGAGLPQLAKLAGDTKSYAERLFDYLEIDRLDAASARAALIEPARRESVSYQEEALEVILEATGRYPFFLQMWGSYAWQVAPASPITAEHARIATGRAVADLDRGLFKVRLERLTERQQAYARALAGLGPTPASSTEVADALGISVKQAAPIRDELIKKGMAYSPKRGRIAFTIPRFDEYLRRKFG